MAAIGEDDDNSKKRRRQNRRLKQISFENGAGGAISKVSPFSLPSSSPSLSELASSNIVGKKYFSPYLSEQAVKDALEKGNAFRSTFRVNAHNRLEAYSSITGVPVDVLINGIEAQNRAIDGDVVAIALDPVADWPKLKGANALIKSMTENNICSSSGRSERNNVLLQEVFDAREESGSSALGRICAMINSHPLKRPTGRVLAILKRSAKRGAVIGFISMNQSPVDDDGFRKKFNGQFSKKNKNHLVVQSIEWIQLIPTDPKFPKMIVSVRTLPDSVKELVKAGDITVERVLVAAEIHDWNEEALYPQALVTDVFGRGGEIKSRIAAILFENSICAENFSQKSLACLPYKPWKIPEEEFKIRKDLRNICSFTIDPSSAIDLDDALSVEIVSNEILRVGVHIADVSYFVLPDTALDTEAQLRSTNVYMLQQTLPMLPPELSEELCSLLPGEDRLTFSIIWEISSSGKITDRWIGRSIIKSCCKLSYEFVQKVIDKSFDVDELSLSTDVDTQFYGHFSLKDVTRSLRNLNEISKRLRKTRFNDGALQFETIKPALLFDEHGTPVDLIMNDKTESCCLVEEFMLLANTSVAEVISQAFPDCSLLLRHPEPNLRKLKEFETFCSKHGFEMDTSSSGQLQISLLKIREEIKNDPVLCDILNFYVSRSMQSAAYFCTGDLKGRENEWAHYALSVPLYTHFTSPIRRYPDVIVHRILCAVLHAELMYLNQSAGKLEESETGVENGCFTGLYFDKHASNSTFGRDALSVSALKLKILEGDALGEVVAHCNERKLSSRLAEEAVEKLFLWALLKKKETLVTEARVLALGPRFMSVYIKNFAIERRINYDEVDCLAVEWLEMTGTLVVDLIRSKNLRKRGIHGKFRPLEDVVLLTESSASDLDEDDSEAVTFEECSPNDMPSGFSEKRKLEAAVFPLVLQNFSSIPVVLHAIGGDDGPLDIGVKLYGSSYFR